MVKISLTALDNDNKIVIAQDVNKDNGPFKCTFCNGDMIIRKGIVKIHHFAHTKDSNCPYATGETMEHEMAKLNLYNLAKSKGIEAKMEDVLSEHVRADLTLMTPEGKIAIEFQKSGMTDEYANLRMDHYKETGIPVIWIMLKNDNYPEHEKELTVTTKDLIFYKIYNNIIYTLYKNDLIDVWRLEAVNRDKNALKMVRKWIHLARLSLLDLNEFEISNNIIIPKKPTYCSAINTRFLHGGEEIDISSDSRDGVFCIYKNCNPEGIVYSMPGDDNYETFPWEDIDDIYEYSPDYIPCYAPQDFIDKRKEWIEELRKKKYYKTHPVEARREHLLSFVKNGAMGNIFVATLYSDKKWNGYFDHELKKGDIVYIITVNGKQRYTYCGYKRKYGIKVGNAQEITIIPWSHIEDIYCIEEDHTIPGAVDPLRELQQQKLQVLHNTDDESIHKDKKDEHTTLEKELINEFKSLQSQYYKYNINYRDTHYTTTSHNIDSTSNNHDKEIDTKRHLSWYLSNKYYNGQPREFAVNCIDNVYQCGSAKSNEILDEWIREGFLVEIGGKIFYGPNSHSINSNRNSGFGEFLEGDKDD